MAVTAAPEAPALGALVVGLAFVLIWALSLALLWAYRSTLGFMLRQLANVLDFHVWRLHFHLGNYVRSIDDAIRERLTDTAGASHRRMGQFFHAAAFLAEWGVRESMQLGNAVLGWGQWLVHVYLRKQAQALHRISAGVGRATRVAHRAEHVAGTIPAKVVKVVTKTVPATAAHVARAVAAPIRAVAVPIPWAVPRIRALEHWRGYTRRQLRRLSRVFSREGAAAIVLVGLAALGLKELSCPALKRLLRRHGCGGFAFLEGLLALTVDVLLVRDLCAIVHAMTRAARETEGVIAHLAEGIGDFIQCQGASRPRDLPLAWHAPPPNTMDLPLRVGA